VSRSIANHPDAVYHGDGLSLSGNGVEIHIVKNDVVNYATRRVC
jgi:hypothetical protein